VVVHDQRQPAQDLVQTRRLGHVVALVADLAPEGWTGRYTAASGFARELGFITVPAAFRRPVAARQPA